MESVDVSAGRDADVALRPDRSGGVVVKWLGAGVVPSGDGELVLGNGKGVAAGEEVGGAERDADAPRRQISCLTIRAALGSEDRKRDVIDPSGWDLEGYRRNPVFLWAHDRSRPPIGKSQRVWVEDDALYAVVDFAPTDFGREIARLYERGFMRGVSVGFLPLETEIRQTSNGRSGYLYRRQELLEISAVPVPMHAGALAGIPRSLALAPPSRSERGSVHSDPLSSRERGDYSLRSLRSASPSRSERDVKDMRDELRRLRVVAESLVG